MEVMQQASLSLRNIIDQVAKDKGIDTKILIETMEAAILTAAKRTFGPTRELEARYNPETGEVDLFQYMTVVEAVANPEREIGHADAKRLGLEAELNDELGFQVFYRDEDAEKARQQDREYGDLLQLQQYRKGFGRIAAQTAKQVIIQRVRDAERDLIFNEFKDRKHETITGIVRRFERGNNIIVDLGRTEAILPSREQTPRESYRPGDRIVAYVKDIDREARGPQIVLSRGDTGLLVKLFEQEVPEIYEGIVKIVAAAREPGARSKIAVTSKDSDVDPVGACVGMKGSRVQAVVQELRGEKIDIVPWDRDPARFVCNAIAPAEVSRVIIDEADGSMELVVPDEKLSLAIGRRGQNVRLASQLTGWKLDIISESKFRQMEEEALTALSLIESVHEGLARSMYKAGFRSLEEVAEANEQELASIPGVGGHEGAATLRRQAEEAMEVRRQNRIVEAATSATPVTERERLLCVRGIGERAVAQLAQGAYRTIEDLYREQDVDRLALKSGLGNRRARLIKEEVARFVEQEWPEAKRAAQALLPAASSDDVAGERAETTG
ncbi:MAG: transcription termination/antitermination protein NusA [Deltaproteobacteria bacterium]|nr:transcription termination/antitermination protein NusA [Deltaproteobacteria bacterium]